MRHIKSVFFIFSQILCLTTACQAQILKDNSFKHPFYIGGIGGYGSTTWSGLVSTIEEEQGAVSVSTPINVKEGGGVWGIYSGYEISRYFAIEANYMRYPDATIFFDPETSLFTFFHDGKTQFISHTSAISLMAKIMLIIPNTTIRAFSSLGAANVHRDDMLNNNWLVSPTFSAGFNYSFTEHLMAEFGGNYTAGFGESSLNPTNTYFPFLYSVTFRLAYCF